MTAAISSELIEQSEIDYECGEEFPCLRLFGIRGASKVRPTFGPGMDGAWAHWLDVMCAWKCLWFHDGWTERKRQMGLPQWIDDLLVVGKRPSA